MWRPQGPIIGIRFQDTKSCTRIRGLPSREKYQTRKSICLIGFPGVTLCKASPLRGEQRF
ncbi:hypothetical protein ACFFGF_03535 [Asaia lannensis]|uniref:Uncharacterized protein n=1 Tax=Asaia lannensis NBRC 102526 TaxID=1307926 RepID=A0ABT1CGM7_9PROT|nr:hypothetical protein [Asaia lannensis]MCO6160015.1 hypothetical protein [Asaia lannensis NBRC 102526]